MAAPFASRKIAALNPPGLPLVLDTVHPSSNLRTPDEETREEARAGFIHDVRPAAAFLCNQK
jgi:hypothetical protein